MTLLFIYGTLMPKLRLQDEMQGARHIGPAQVAASLVDVGQYPGLVPGNGQVTGEIYDVDDEHLVRLDLVEGMVRGDRSTSQYWRETVTVLSGPLQGQSVQTYVYNRPVDACAPIPHGDYRRYIREVGRET